MKGDGRVCLPRNRPSHCKMDGVVSVQHGGCGCNGVELKFVESLPIQDQKMYCSCIHIVLTQWTGTALPQPPPETNEKNTYMNWFSSSAEASSHSVTAYYFTAYLSIFPVSDNLSHLKVVGGCRPIGNSDKCRYEFQASLFHVLRFCEPTHSLLLTLKFYIHFSL
jgi:hypothetical protein